MESVVDGNMHIVSPSTARDRYPLHPLDGSPELRPDEVVDIDRLSETIGEAGVTRAVIAGSRQHGFDNSYCADSVAMYPGRFAGIANVNVLSAKAADAVDYWIRERGMHGVRFWGDARGAATWIDDPKLSAAWARVCELRVPANAQTTDPSVLGKTARLLSRFPHLTLIVNSLGRVPPAEGSKSEAAEQLLSLAEYPGVYVNFPVEFALEARQRSGPRELLDALVQAFGSERLFWVSFYPSRRDRPYKQSVGALRGALGYLSDTDQRMILGGTAMRLYSALEGG